MKPWHQENGIISPEFTFEFYSDKVLEYSRRLPTLKTQLSYLIDVWSYYLDEMDKYSMDRLPDEHPFRNDPMFLKTLRTEVLRLQSQIKLATEEYSEENSLRDALRSKKLYDYLINELSKPEYNIFDHQGNFIYQRRDCRRIAIALGDTLNGKGYFKSAINWSSQNKSTLLMEWFNVKVGEKSSTLYRNNYEQMKKFAFIKQAKDIL